MSVIDRVADPSKGRRPPLPRGKRLGTAPAAAVLAVNAECPTDDSFLAVSGACPTAPPSHEQKRLGAKPSPWATPPPSDRNPRVESRGPSDLSHSLTSLFRACAQSSPKQHYAARSFDVISARLRNSRSSPTPHGAPRGTHGPTCPLRACDWQSGAQAARRRVRQSREGFRSGHRARRAAFRRFFGCSRLLGTSRLGAACVAAAQSRWRASAGPASALPLS
jgi:hypothetical protein